MRQVTYSVSQTKTVNKAKLKLSIKHHRHWRSLWPATFWGSRSHTSNKGHGLSCRKGSHDLLPQQCANTQKSLELHLEACSVERVIRAAGRPSASAINNPECWRLVAWRLSGCCCCWIFVFLPSIGTTVMSFAAEFSGRCFLVRSVSDMSREASVSGLGLEIPGLS